MVRLSQEEQLEALLAKYEPYIRDAFRAAIRNLASSAQVGRVIESLEQRDIEGAVRALHIDPAAYSGLGEAIRQAFIEGGATTAATLPSILDAAGARVVIRFDVRNPQAEAWLDQHSSEMVTGLVDDQRVAVRAALREGMEAGVNPRTTALNIVGRIDPTSQRRVGGILGLSVPQERYVASARAELLSGDPALLRNYLTRARRDKRFDSYVRKAIKDKKPLDAATASRAVGRYSDRLLQLRGETIGRTESMASLNQAAMEAHRQAVAKGNVRAQDVRKIWVATKDKRTRDTHRHLDGESAGLEQRFDNGLLYPGDPAGDVAEIVNCRCVLKYRINFLSNLT